MVGSMIDFAISPVGGVKVENEISCPGCCFNDSLSHTSQRLAFFSNVQVVRPSSKKALRALLVTTIY